MKLSNTSSVLIVVAALALSSLDQCHSQNIDEILATHFGDNGIPSAESEPNMAALEEYTPEIENYSDAKEVSAPLPEAPVEAAVAPIEPEDDIETDGGKKKRQKKKKEKEIYGWYDPLKVPVPPIEYEPTTPGMPGVTCIDRSLEVKNGGPGGVQCIKRDQAICRGDWMFGIVNVTTSNNYTVTAWKSSHDYTYGYTDIVYAAYEGAKEICVGKTSRSDGNTAFMTIKVETGTYYLVCPHVGKLSKNPKLKIRVRKDKEKKRNKNKRDQGFYDTIVKYRRGANDEDTLWAVLTDGTEKMNDGCYWKFIGKNETVTGW